MQDPPPTRPALPTGTVTFLFTDIEGSTRLLGSLGDEYQRVLERHAVILRAAIEEGDGVEVNTEGDAFFAVFTTPAAAVAAATAAQRGLASEDWPFEGGMRVRMGIHSGEGRLGGDDYIGMDVHRAARIAAAAHGGQVLVSDATRSLVGTGTDGVELRGLGLHQLKDLDAPERLWQLVIGDLPGDFPPPRAGRSGNVPTPTTGFVGRDVDVAAVMALLDEARLVTITGPGGSGKTRLSLQVARLEAAARLDGAWFVPLDTLREPALLPAAIASVLDVGAVEEDAIPALLAHLADRDLLLLLDNFEHIAPAAAVVDALIDGTADVRVLATSQRPLGLYGEREYPVPPLSVPDPAARPSTESLLDYEAVALFVSRAQAARPRFELDETNAAAVVEVVRRLDGQPLAIELAAARIKLLTPQAMLKRLEQRLDLLSSTATNLPERQRTLRGAIDWSYGLLEPAEQLFFDRLGVFAGGFGLEAAEQVVAGGDDDAMELLDVLGSIVEKSLVRQDEIDGEPRFSQLESIRQYALERLAARGEEPRIQERLATLIIELVESAERHLDRSDDQVWFARIDVEQDNLRAALRWAIAASRADLAQRIVGPVWRYWVRKGLIAEGSWWTDEVLRLPSDASAGRAKTLIAQGSLAYWRNDYDDAEASYAAALQLSRSLRDEGGITEASYNLGYAQIFKREIDGAAARASFETALAGFRAAGDDAMTQSTLFTIGWIEGIEGRFDEAEVLFLQALEMDAGDVRPRTGLATVAYDRGDYEASRRWLRESVEQTRDMPDLAFRIVQLEGFVPIEVSDGDAELAMTLLGAARRLREDIGGGPPPNRGVRIDAEAEARAAIGDEATDAALAAGRAMTADEAIELAIRERRERKH